MKIHPPLSSAHGVPGARTVTRSTVYRVCLPNTRAEHGSQRPTWPWVCSLGQLPGPRGVVCGGGRPKRAPAVLRAAGCWRRLGAGPCRRREHGPRSDPQHHARCAAVSRTRGYRGGSSVGWNCNCGRLDTPPDAEALSVSSCRFAARAFVLSPPLAPAAISVRPEATLAHQPRATSKVTGRASSGLPSPATLSGQQSVCKTKRAGTDALGPLRSGGSMDAVSSPAVNHEGAPETLILSGIHESNLLLTALIRRGGSATAREVRGKF